MNKKEIPETRAIFRGSAPQEAATVVLLREEQSRTGIEVYVMRRRGSLRFAPDHSVFPGGKLEPDDCSPEVLSHCAGVSTREAASLLSAHQMEHAGLGYWVAAIRELFEETGILLCTPDLPPDRRAQARAALHARTLSWREFLKMENLTVRVSALRYLARWITPREALARWEGRVVRVGRSQFRLAP